MRTRSLSKIIISPSAAATEQAASSCQPCSCAARAARHPWNATALEAANVGLAVAFALLAFHGWRAAVAARLRGWQLLGACSVAAALGLIMILLKDLVLIHLH